MKLLTLQEQRQEKGALALRKVSPLLESLRPLLHDPTDPEDPLNEGGANAVVPLKFLHRPDIRKAAEKFTRNPTPYAEAVLSLGPDTDLNEFTKAVEQVDKDLEKTKMRMKKQQMFSKFSKALSLYMQFIFYLHLI